MDNCSQETQDHPDANIDELICTDNSIGKIIAPVLLIIYTDLLI
jgi:hypothetical protein